MAALTAAALSGWRWWRRPAPAALPLWACGADDLTPRMQYTATSFAEPLQRVFDDVLRPDTDIEVTHAAESQYLADSITYRSRIDDAIEERLYTPLIRVVAAAAETGAARPHRQRAPVPGLRCARRAHRAGGGPMNVLSYLAGAVQIGTVTAGAPLVVGAHPAGARTLGGPRRRRAAAALARHASNSFASNRSRRAAQRWCSRPRPPIVAGSTLLDRRDCASGRHRIPAGRQRRPVRRGGAAVSSAPSR